MDNDIQNHERELYQVAAKKSAVSRSFDRILMVVVSIALIGIICYIGYAQYQYQQNSREITRARNDQLQQILQSNEETKAMIRCAVEQRQTGESDNITRLNQCVEDHTVVVENLNDRQ